MKALMHYFENADSIVRDFQLTETQSAWLNRVTILIAVDNGDGYNASAFILMRDTEGTLWEVNGSHCSCYGYEDQWIPEETTLEAIALRPFDRGEWQDWYDYPNRITCGEVIRDRVQLLLRE